MIPPEQGAVASQFGQIVERFAHGDPRRRDGGALGQWLVVAGADGDTRLRSGARPVVRGR